MSNPIKLLIADDHTLFRRGLVGLLNQRPEFQIVGEVNNGIDAVQIGLQHQPDIILMDVHMPGGNGIKAVEALKRETAVRIVMLTISDKDEDLLGALAAGADGYLLKNVELKQLCKYLKQIAKGHSVLSPEITEKVIQAAIKTQQPQQPTIKLSKRECEVLEALAQGETTTEIATSLFISKNTAKTHIRRILKKLEASNRVEAVARATSLGIISSQL
ncbi:MAG: response regulator transcription factor [Chloroflexi bacterium]|nr:response regulator transcription factor [Chloroflexota bacterium]